MFPGFGEVGCSKAIVIDDSKVRKRNVRNILEGFFAKIIKAWSFTTTTRKCFFDGIRGDGREEWVVYREFQKGRVFSSELSDFIRDSDEVGVIEVRVVWDLMGLFQGFCKNSGLINRRGGDFVVVNDWLVRTAILTSESFEFGPKAFAVPVIKGGTFLDPFILIEQVDL